MSSTVSSLPPHLSTLAGTGVVGGEGGDHVAVVAVEQFAQEEGAVADVDFGVAEVVELEGRAAAVALDVLRRFRRDLHQAARAGARGLVAERRLGVDHGGDQRRVDVLFLGLLADDVLVAQRQGQLLDRLVEHAGGDQDADHAATARRPRPDGEQAPPALASRFIPSASRRGRTAPARGPRRVPSFSITCVGAAGLLRLGELARLALADQGVAARLGAARGAPRRR